MGTSYYKLDIENRDSVGKKATKEMRRAGMVPSTLYFKGEKPESIAVEKLKLYQALKSDQRIYEIELEGESQYVMVKAVQYHPVTDEILHLDFMRVRRSEKMTISVPLVLVGKPIGVTEGGILSQALNQIEISCFPTNVPEQIEVNIDDMELNSSISIADVSYDDEEVDIISAEDINVASITAPVAEEEITEADVDDSVDDSADGGEKDEKSEDSSDQKESSE
ncbi:50S ribosomal protein L25 [bacterium]|jgi:large subunit ribosomal protein L25|nr:50S ribosomal protein L25 [bacterium]MBT5734108.1 50S ribosomal protein L25 [bacterium]MBT6019065.1 50S ribosomal protein L25 [bacterium]MBT6776422.1 50S ribosomal protein L25 [bacterium]